MTRGFQEVRCPVSNHVLFEAVGLSTHLVIRIICRCKRVCLVKEGFVVSILEESPTTMS
jgi:hypothetical protein